MSQNEDVMFDDKMMMRGKQRGVSSSGSENKQKESEVVEGIGFRKERKLSQEARRTDPILFGCEKMMMMETESVYCVYGWERC